MKDIWHMVLTKSYDYSEDSYVDADLTNWVCQVCDARE